MKLTKKTESEARRAYDLYWNSYFKGDEETFASVLDDAFQLIGTSEKEICHNKTEAIDYFRSTLNEVKGKAEFRNREITLVPATGVVLINEIADTYFLTDDEWIFYSKIRLSTLLHKSKAGWKVLQQHGSLPQARVQESEPVAYQQIKTENLHLRETVKRRTIELERKNRELEIEAALERVQSAAMAMHAPADMLRICRVVAEQLQLLGVKDLRNTQTVVLNDAKQTYMNYEYFTAYENEHTLEVHYDAHPEVTGFVQQIRTTNDAFFTTVIEGEKMREWRNYIKVNESFPDTKIDEASSIHYYFYSIGPGALGISTYNTPMSEDNIAVLKRFRNVFALAYRRYQDIEQAIAQARAAQIELGLERVRARAMAMQNSDELSELVATVFNELTRLDFNLTSCIIWINHPEQASDALWVASSEINKPAQPYYIKPFQHQFFKSIIQAWKAKDQKWIYTLRGDEKRMFQEAFFMEVPILPDVLRKLLEAPEEVVFSASFNNSGALEIVGNEALPDDKFEILHRFGRVFDLSYTRFNDLKKAEAQAREAQIEVALEKVRTRSLAMYKSDELQEVVNSVFARLLELNIELDTAIIIIFDARSKDSVWWLVNRKGQQYPRILVRYTDDRHIRRITESRENGVEFFSECYPQEDKNALLNYLFGQTDFKHTPQEQKEYLLEFEFGSISVSLTKNIGIQVTRYSENGFSEKENEILRKFVKVFDQAYTRFLDLQNAEAQAREGQIQLAMERVRARTMAMQKSDELPAAANLLFQQVQSLGMPAWSAGYCIWDQDKKAITLWMSSEGVLQPPFKLPLTEDPSCMHFLEAYQKGETFYVEEIGGEELVTHYTYMRSLPVVGEVLQSINDAGFPLPSFQIFHCAYFSKGFLLFITYEPVPEAHDIFKRFGKVFDQTYTRFLDLQNAEAQAREAQIELALERVRARAMAMQNSSELSDLVDIMFKELTKLDFALNWCMINIIDVSTLSNMVWAANPDIDKAPDSYHMKFEDYPFHDAMMKGYLERASKYIYVLEGVEKKEYDEYLFKETAFSKVPEEAQAASRAMEKYVCSFTFSHFGGLQTVGNEPLSDINLDILERFGKVFDLTYTRFNDLLKAEAQAREAQIEASLERVRSRAMAIRKSDELSEVIQIIFQEMNKLGIDLMECSIATYDDTNPKDLIFWSAGPLGSAHSSSTKLQYIDHPLLIELLNDFGSGTQYRSGEYSGELLNTWWDRIFAETDFRYAPKDFIESWKKIKQVFYLQVATNHGFLEFLGKVPLPEDKVQILKRFTNVIDLTYTRYDDVVKAEAQAREGQIEAALERVRSRSMGMQKSEELKEVIKIVYQQLRHLKIKLEHAGFVVDYTPRGDWHFWIADERDIPSKITHPYFESVWATQFDEAKEKGEDLFATHLNFEEKNKFYKALLSYVPGIPETSKEFYLNCPGLAATTVLLENIGLYIENFSGTPYTDEENATLMRFGKVFQQTYTRFLDLQKAEAQTREAQIEAALEKVRSRTMAMQQSNELGDVATVLFKEMNHLVKNLWTCGFVLCEKDRAEDEWWLSTESGFIPAFYIPNTGDRVHENLYTGWKNGEAYRTEQIEGEELELHYEWLMNIPVSKKIFDDFAAAGFERPTWQKLYAAYFSKGYLCIITREPCPEEEVFKRFAQVFDLTYTRFLDLQKAEAQAWEAKIEVALERVRARSMGMHKSDEINEVITLVFEQLRGLDIFMHGAMIYLFEDPHDDFTLWLQDSVYSFAEKLRFTFLDNPFFTSLINARNSKQPIITDLLNKEKKDEFFEFSLEHSDLKNVSEDRKRFVLAKPGYARSIAVSKHMALAMDNFDAIAYTDEENSILLRFSNVFEQTYTRFLDLQKAEAQAREAKIEAALERVRSKTMAMHNSQDVGNTVATMFDQLVHLGVTTNRCGILIFGNTNINEAWTAKSNPTGEAALIIGHLDFTIHPLLQGIKPAWKNKESYYSYEMAGDDLKNYYTALNNYPEYPVRFNLDNLPVKEFHSDFFFPEGAVFAFTAEPISEEAALIFKRFAGVFGQTYRRYLDLQKAEAQAREAQIEVALERVRARTMAMHNSNDVGEATATMFKELEKLGIQNNRGGIAIISEDQTMEVWSINIIEAGKIVNGVGNFDMNAHPMWLQMFHTWKNKEGYMHSYLSGNSKEEYLKIINSNPHYLSQPLKELADMNFQAYVFNEGTIWAYSLHPHSEEDRQILKRFASVYSLTFRRYMDLKKAEAQTREAKIEAALERTRTQSMIMQHSKELDDALRVFHEQVLLLGIHSAFSFLWLPDEEKDRHIFWAAWGEEQNKSTVYKSKAINYPLDRNEPATAQCLVDWKGNEPIVSYHVPPAGVENYFSAWQELIDGAEQLKPEYFSGGLYYVEAFMKYGCFGVIVVSDLTEDEKKILGRFAIEFERTYTRFLDLQKAEANAREAQIEAALERVRSKAMAMHNSADLSSAASIVFSELRKLGITPMRCGISLQNKENRKNLLYSSTSTIEEDNVSLTGWAILDDHPVLAEIYDSWIRGEDYFPVLKGEVLKSYYEKIKSSFVVPPSQQTDDYEQYGYFIAFSHGMFYGWAEKPFDENARNILKRFASVVDLTFKRYFDLQKAEANAREALVEAGLERVRSRTLAMHSSEELTETAAVLFRQLISLGIAPNRLYIAIIKDESGELEFWITDEDGSKVSQKFTGNINRNASVRRMYEGWREQRKSIAMDMQGEELKEYFRYLSEELHVPFKGGLSQKRRVQNIGYFSKGFIGIASPDDQPEETRQLIERFAAVFNLTHARFNDLKQAEAQTRKARIETALEKVRARALAMQQPEELVEVAEVMRSEMGLLGVEELETSTIFIHEDKGDTSECWFAIKDIRQADKKLITDHISLDLNKTWVGREMLLFYNADEKQTSIPMKGPLRREWVEYAYALSSVFSGFYGENIPDRTYHLCKFSHGAIGASTPADISEENWELLQRAASVFSLAYSRFKDLTQSRLDLQKLQTEKTRAEDALTNLQAAQAQLIHAEKLASLGQLTAGIAHEIKNPLNFVNNFSDVSRELLDEMLEELEKGNAENVKSISDAIKSNLDKIHDHGSRADSIVKSMLMHSRGGSGLKEPADINALIREYVNLTFHGMRAGKHPINVRIDLQLDDTLSNVPVIVEDMSRVLINLCNNAFDAMRSKLTDPSQKSGYTPKLTVRTKQDGNHVMIEIADNGPGIPEDIKDKILQPFFTTKKGTQGTGLGLSITNDIVKAHGGELKVETKEGEGSEFIISLPLHQ